MASRYCVFGKYLIHTKQLLSRRLTYCVRIKKKLNWRISDVSVKCFCMLLLFAINMTIRQQYILHVCALSAHSVDASDQLKSWLNCSIVSGKTLKYELHFNSLDKKQIPLNTLLGSQIPWIFDRWHCCHRIVKCIVECQKQSLVTAKPYMLNWLVYTKQFMHSDT